MNCIQKTATAVIALVITFGGATFATAPLTLGTSRPVASHVQVNSQVRASEPAGSHRFLLVRRA